MKARLLILVGGAAAGVIAWAGFPHATRPPVRSSAGPPVVDQDISFYEARVARDRYGARDRAMLASLYLARGRASGSEHDLVRSEALARESQGLRSNRNEGVASILVGALLAEHKFVEAHVIMAGEVAADSTNAVARASLGEIDLELGRYSEADRLFHSVELQRITPAIGSRYARWLELNGHPGEARLLLESIRDQLSRGFRVPVEERAWFELRIGDLAARNGRADLADQAYARGLTLAPDDARLLTALALLRADQKAWREAIDLGQRALAGRFDPATLALLSDCYAAVGDSAMAEQYVRGMEAAISAVPGGFHRGWALFLLDHDRRVADVLSRAEADLIDRKDVYGYDLTGWARFRAGKVREALPYADSALSRGTRDALLYYHAGVIALAAGDSTLARARLDTALAINPLFHPSHADHARALLSGLSPR
jgi:tetratricopeptide (TPR) repeat protein